MFVILVFIISGLSCCANAPAVSKPDQNDLISQIPWSKYGDEAVSLLQNYIKLTTTNPPGNETIGARYLKSILDDHHIHSELVWLDSSRANLIAVLKGKGIQKPILLLNHIDVVDVEKEQWSVDPFSGIVKDGYIWGRGALDMKSTAITQLMALLVIKRLGLNLDRDLIFLSVADEEVEGKYGAQFITENHFDKVNCEYVLNEGGCGIDVDGKKIFAVENAQKSCLWLKLTTRGKGGHGSAPLKNSANQKLLSALHHLQIHVPDLIITEPARAFFQNYAKTEKFPKSFFIRNIAHPMVKWLVGSSLRNDEDILPIVSNTITITKIESGFKTNVVPTVANAYLDCRLLPGQDHQEFIKNLYKIIKDTTISISTVEGSDTFANLPSPTATRLFAVIQEVVNDNCPDYIVTPALIPGTSDSRFFRRKNIVTYGVMPFILNPDELRRIHGADERISTANIHLGVKLLTEILIKMGS